MKKNKNTPVKEVHVPKKLTAEEHKKTVEELLKYARKVEDTRMALVQAEAELLAYAGYEMWYRKVQ